MAFRRTIGRSLVALIGAALLVGGVIAAILIYPEPLYAHSVSAGRLSLHSDRAFDPEAGRAVLADVERRLAAAPAAIADPESRYRIFVSHAEWRRRLTFLWTYGAGGVNFYPIAGSVFLRQADIEAGRLLRTDGAHVPSPRTLAYYGAHEIAHSFIGKRVGATANWHLPEWVREGLADYVAFAGDVDIEDLTRQLRAGAVELDPARSGLYARYRLLVAYYLDREGWSVDALLAEPPSQGEAERRLLAAVPE